MQNFISTETLILVSFLCKKMPNLLKYLRHDSLSTNAMNEQNANIARISAKQIQIAKQHPSNIVIQTLATAAIVQKALDAAAYKIEDLIKQRDGLQEKIIALTKAKEEIEAEIELELDTETEFEEE